MDTAKLPLPFVARLRSIAWPRPDPELADAGREGEVVIANARLVVVGLLLFPALATCVREPSSPSGWIALAMALACITVGTQIRRRARANDTDSRLQLVTTLLDVSLVSVFHVLLFAAGETSMVLQSRVTFCLYIIAIIGAALRYDGQLVRISGATAMVQYLSLITWINLSGAAGVPGDRFYGDSTLAGQAEEVGMLLIATVLGSIIVERARQLRLSGIRDSLTRLANRSYFAERFDSELQRAVEAETTGCVAMIDIDHFKRVNDTYGHAAGDQVLRHVAAELRRAAGEDLVARVGGEEFAILFADMTLDVARARLDAMRSALESSVVKLRGVAAVRVTISTGIAAWPADGVDTVRLLEVADTRLLAGKRAGRNVVVATG